MHKRPSLTIGIPAYNEERTILTLLDSLFQQNQSNFVLKKILVCCDGCTDSTAKKVKQYAKSHSLVEVVDGHSRVGKSQRLNYIYAHTHTDLLATFDADVFLYRPCEIENMVGTLQSKKTIQLVGARFIPVLQKSWWGKCSRISYLSFEYAAIRLNHGDNFYTLVGGATLLTKNLAQAIRFPIGTISDQNYLYGMSKKLFGDCYALAMDTMIMVQTVGTFHDWRLLATRAIIGDKENTASSLGKDVMDSYTMPLHLYLRGIEYYLLHEPIATMGSIFMNIFIRLFPLHRHAPKNGMWEITQTAKQSYT